MQDQMIHIFECLEGIGCNVKYLEDGLFYSLYLIIIGYHICCGSKHLLSNCESTDFISSQDCITDKVSFKVCHSSAFQTISVRSVYFKIINYSGSIFANLNKTMQTKQDAMKKPQSYSNRNKIYKELFLMVEGY